MSDPNRPPTSSTPRAPEESGREPQSRRRAAPPQKGRRVDAVLVAAVLVPLLVLLAGAAIRVGAPEPQASAPDVEGLNETTIACPSAGVPAGAADIDEVVPQGGTIRAATAPEASADLDVVVGEGGEETAAPVADGSVADQETGDLAVVRADEQGAAGLVAGRFDASGGAGVTCRTPTSGAWFAGLGAGSERSSVVELSNPDSGNAVATLTLYDENGVVRADSIRSVVISSGGMRRLDLGALAPTAGELALHVDVTRGRLGIEALQTTDPLDGGAGASYWAAPVSEPSTSTTLLGLPGEADARRTLLVANPGEESAQVGVQVLGAEGAFAPTGLDEIVVQPGAVTSVDLTAVIGSALGEGAEGAVGIEVDATGPVVASLRSGEAAEESAAAVATPVPELTASGDLGAVLPPGLSAGSVVVANTGGDEATPEVVVRDASGAQIGSQELTLAASAATRVDLPAQAARVEVTGVGADDDVRGAVVATAQRTSVLALAAVIGSELVPSVRREWP